MISQIVFFQKVSFHKFSIFIVQLYRIMILGNPAGGYQSAVKTCTICDHDFRCTQRFYNQGMHGQMRYWGLGNYCNTTLHMNTTYDSTLLTL